MCVFLLSLFVTLCIYLHLTARYSSTLGKGWWVGAVCTFWYQCPLEVLGCESLHVCTVCIWRCEHARFCVELEVVFCAVYTFSFIHSFTWVVSASDCRLVAAAMASVYTVCVFRS